MMKKIFNKLFLSLLAIVFCVDFYKAPPPPPSGGAVRQHQVHQHRRLICIC